MGKVLLIRVRIQIGHGLLRSATLFLLIAAGSGECILFLSVLYSVEIVPLDYFAELIVPQLHGGIVSFPFVIEILFA